jgi:hypothetical protein
VAHGGNEVVIAIQQDKTYVQRSTMRPRLIHVDTLVGIVVIVIAIATAIAICYHHLHLVIDSRPDWEEKAELECDSDRNSGPIQRASMVS